MNDKLRGIITVVTPKGTTVYEYKGIRPPNKEEGVSQTEFDKLAELVNSIEPGITKAELENQSNGIRNWLRERSAKRDYLSYSGSYHNVSNPPLELKAGDYGVTRTDLLPINNPGIDFSFLGNDFSFITFAVEQAYGDTLKLEVQILRGCRTFTSYKQGKDEWSKMTEILNTVNTEVDENGFIKIIKQIPKNDEGEL